MVNQFRDVGSPFPQRRYHDGEHAQPESEIVPERPLAHQFLEVPVRGDNDPHVHLYRLRPSHALDLLFLEHPEKSSLCICRQVSDFVEKDRAAVGKLEAPIFPGQGTGIQLFAGIFGIASVLLGLSLTILIFWAVISG